MNCLGKKPEKIYEGKPGKLSSDVKSNKSNEHKVS